MKDTEKRILHQGIGFVVVGILVFCIGSWFLKQTLSKEDHTYPILLEIGTSVFLLAFSLMNIYRGLKGISLAFSKEEREKEKWVSHTLEEADTYRGGSRKTVIVLGLIAIALISTFIAWALILDS